MVCQLLKNARSSHGYLGSTAIAISLIAAFCVSPQRVQDGDHEQFLRKWGDSSLLGKMGRPSSPGDSLAFLRVAENVPEFTRVGLNLGTVYCSADPKDYGGLSKKMVREFVDRLWRIITNRRNAPGVVGTAIGALGRLAANDEAARKRMHMLISAKDPLPGTLKPALGVYCGLRANTRELATLRRLLDSEPSIKKAAALTLGYQGYTVGKEAESILIEMLKSSDDAEASDAWSAIGGGRFYSPKILDIFVSWLDDRTGKNPHGWAITSLVRAREKAVPALIAYVEGRAPHQFQGRVDPDGFIRAIVIFASIGRTQAAIPTINKLTKSRKDRVLPVSVYESP